MSIEPPLEPPAPPFNSTEAGEILQRFVDAGNRVFEAKVDDLIRVRMSGSLSVIAVEILETSLDRELRLRLETAIASAVNTAQQRAVLAAGQALSDFPGRASV